MLKLWYFWLLLCHVDCNEAKIMQLNQTLRLWSRFIMNRWAKALQKSIDFGYFWTFLFFFAFFYLIKLTKGQNIAAYSLKYHFDGKIFLKSCLEQCNSQNSQIWRFWLFFGYFPYWKMPINNSAHFRLMKQHKEGAYGLVVAIENKNTALYCGPIWPFLEFWKWVGEDPRLNVFNFGQKWSQWVPPTLG